MRRGKCKGGLEMVGKKFRNDDQNLIKKIKKVLT